MNFMYAYGCHLIVAIATVYIVLTSYRYIYQIDSQHIQRYAARINEKNAYTLYGQLVKTTKSFLMSMRFGFSFFCSFYNVASGLYRFPGIDYLLQSKGII